MLSGPLLVLWLELMDAMVRGSLVLCLIVLVASTLALCFAIDSREWDVRP